MQAVLTQPRGFCAGVTRALEIVERALTLQGAPVCGCHEIVHNQWMVGDLARCGLVVVDEIEHVPVGSTVIFSAHGVSTRVVAHARRLALKTIDATCPLVSKVHQQAQRFVRLGHTPVVISHAGHNGVEGMLGRVNAPVHLVNTVDDAMAPDLPVDVPLAYLTQTTPSLNDTREVIATLKARFLRIAGLDVSGICYDNQNRQVAVRVLATRVDRVLVVGTRNSSNANRLRKVAGRAGVPDHLVQDATEIRPDWLEGAARIGLTSGASTPELLVQQLIDALRTRARHNGPVLPVLQLPGAQEGVLIHPRAELVEPMG